ncbi:hypothetical protein Snas_4411 [Stackebrandtia nassauensis DSM 44728]|uniref:Uncharacterized protein n=1 Tax=Stackebrandtia nassauensis (strain DSM 44728 / CIP 108903 / NRRL B-16338 / NBRC 102104 / LLR-40K-21) TaxID=446470 RepID=D3Q3Z0_STANL|nr:hypothetical protein Snas_4411 [Stackebrandtia nassauensis DSM 44728]
MEQLETYQGKAEVVFIEITDLWDGLIFKPAPSMYATQPGPTWMRPNRP